MEFVRPPQWVPMPGDDLPPAQRDRAWYSRFTTPTLAAWRDVDMLEQITNTLRVRVPHARVEAVERVQHRGLWRSYVRFRDEWIASGNGGDANERWLFLGTGAVSPAEVETTKRDETGLASCKGLRPLHHFPSRWRRLACHGNIWCLRPCQISRIASLERLLTTRSTIGAVSLLSLSRSRSAPLAPGRARPALPYDLLHRPLR